MSSRASLGRALSVCATLLVAASAFAGFAGTDLFLPNVGRQAGIFPSNWYTTVWIYNPGTDAATARVYLLARNTANATPPYVDVTVAAGDTTKLENVVESLFHQQVFGALRVMCDTQKLVVTSRVYSKGAGAGENDSVGQDFAGVPASFAIGNGESTQVLGAHQTEPATGSDYRFNFGFVETTGHSASVTVTAFDEDGRSLGSTPSLQVREFSQRQLAFKDYFPAVSTENVRLQVAVTSGSGKIIAYGSGIANASQDPTTFEMQYADTLLGISTVQHDTTLTGDGTAGAPLGLADGAVTDAKVANGIAYSKLSGPPTSLPPSGPASGALSGAYPNPGLASGQVVKTINGLKDDVTLAATGAVTLTPSGNTLTIGSSGIALPFAGSVSSAAGAFAITNTGAGPALSGSNSSSGDGVHGQSDSGAGVSGLGFHGAGVYGSNLNLNGVGVRGSAPSGNGVVGESGGFGYAAVYGNNPNGYGVFGQANSSATAGVLGSNGPGPGVFGSNSTGNAVYGLSTSGNGVSGRSNGASAGGDGGNGVYGYSPGGVGVAGYSDSGYGIKCYGNGGYTGSWSNLSDIRLKKDVSPLSGALSLVLALRGVTFTWRRDEFPELHLNDGQQIGFIAQEVEPVLPEVVTTDPQGYKAIDYSKLTPVLVEAIKAQQQQLESLTQRLAQLEALLASRNNR